MIPRRTPFLVAAAALAFGAALSGCSSTSVSPPVSTAPPSGPQLSSALAQLPKPDHVVVVIFENKPERSVQGSSDAPYFNQLAAKGAAFTSWSAVTHPSQPNYLAMFSGSTQGITDDSCLDVGQFSGPDLGGELIAAGKTFVGYSESMPSDGFKDCTGHDSAGKYASKHNPWRDFSDVPAASNLTFAAFPKDFSKLPTVAYIDPNLCDDMHDCSVATGDAWLKANMSAYADWASANHSLLIVTFDEDDHSENNVIPSFIVGADVKPGVYDQKVDHYSLLRTLEDMYGLPHAGSSAQAAPISGMWTTGS